MAFIDARSACPLRTGMALTDLRSGPKILLLKSVSRGHKAKLAFERDARKDRVKKTLVIDGENECARLRDIFQADETHTEKQPAE